MTDGTTEGLNKAAVFICHCSGNISEHVDIDTAPLPSTALFSKSAYRKPD